MRSGVGKPYAEGPKADAPARGDAIGGECEGGTEVGKLLKGSLSIVANMIAVVLLSLELHCTSVARTEVAKYLLSLLRGASSSNSGWDRSCTHSSLFFYLVQLRYIHAEASFHKAEMVFVGVTTKQRNR